MAQAHRDDPRARYHRERDRLAIAAGEKDAEKTTATGGKLRGDVSPDDADAIRQVLDALDDENPAEVFSANGNGAETKAPKTLSNYTSRLRLAATELDGGLLEQSTEDINAFHAALVNGDAEIAPDDGYSKGSVGQYQSALKALYRYHDGHDVDPEEIRVFAPEDTSVDERDMFTVDEVQAMRDAINDPRNRCLFELLAFTGQRIRVIQTLRIGDVDLDDEVFYINTDEEGLKDAKGKRPLLGATAYVRRWINEYHPTGEDGDYLITPRATGGGTPGDMLTQDTIRYHLDKIAERADVEKDVHPHIFRHYFTTVAKREYGMDDAYIKHLRGDAPGSNVMETTYRHLSDSDAVEHADAMYRGEEPEQEESLAPQNCPTCGEILEADAKACGNCGAVFTMDAKAAQDDIEDSVKQEYRETDPEDEEKLEELDVIDEALDVPAVRERILDAVVEELDT